MFNIFKITKDYDPETITPETRIKGDFIVPETENEGEDHVTFYQDPRWKNGSMLFVHAIRDKDDMIVSVLMEPLPKDGKIIFKMSKETFEELCKLARQFEASLEPENYVDDLEDNTQPERDLEDNGEDIERLSMVNTRRNKGNKYASVVQLLL